MRQGRHWVSLGTNNKSLAVLATEEIRLFLQETVSAGARDLWLWGDRQLPVCSDPAAPE